MTLPEALYTAAQVRELDRLAIEERGIAGATLMQRAGAAAFELLRVRWPRARRIAVVCGPGNNGGDGYVLARLAGEQGLAPVVLGAGAPRAEGDAARPRARALRRDIFRRPRRAAGRLWREHALRPPHHGGESRRPAAPASARRAQGRGRSRAGAR